jgi:hypothetical protein
VVVDWDEPKGGIGVTDSFEYDFLLLVCDDHIVLTTGMENSAFVISLKTVACFVSGGSAGICSSIVATDCMLVLLAHRTSMGLCMSCFPGQFCGTKWLVAAVSGYAVW